MYADVEGRYFEYKGNPIDIVEGIGSERWLSLPNVRKTLTELPRYATLNRLYPKATRLDGKLSAEFIESLAIVDFLKKSQDQRSIRFLRWLQREVIFPAEKREASHGL